MPWILIAIDCRFWLWAEIGKAFIDLKGGEFPKTALSRNRQENAFLTAKRWDCAVKLF
jgi:hypothetical protein